MSLDEARQQIEEEVDRMALRVGLVLAAAKRDHPAEFDAWVINELPFGLETARRLIAITKAYAQLPPEKLAQLPRPWQALYALKSIPQDQLDAAIAAGEIGPSTTVTEAKRFARVVRGSKPWQLRDETRRMRAERTAAALMQFSADDLSPAVTALLRRWIG